MKKKTDKKKKKDFCGFGYCTAIEKNPCFCECHRRGEKGCWKDIKFN